MKSLNTTISRIQKMEMNSLISKIIICPRENKNREFRQVDQFTRQYGVMYKCITCGQVVNEAYIVFEEKHRSSHKT